MLGVPVLLLAQHVLLATYSGAIEDATTTSVFGATRPQYSDLWSDLPQSRRLEVTRRLAVQESAQSHPAGPGHSRERAHRGDRLNAHPLSITTRHQGHGMHHRFELKVHTGGAKKKMLVYVLCFDSASCQAAHSHFGHFSWCVRNHH